MSCSDVCKKIIEKTKDPFYFVFRVVVGLMFALHGAGKFGLIGSGSVSGFAGVMGFPVWLAVIVALIELVGGIAILVGFFTRPVSSLGAIVMIVALIIAHFPKGINPLTNGGELALMYLVAFLVIHNVGSGKWGLEKLIFKKELF